VAGNGCSRVLSGYWIIELCIWSISFLSVQVWTLVLLRLIKQIPRHQSSPIRNSTSLPRSSSPVRRKWIDEAGGEWIGRDVCPNIVCMALPPALRFPREEHRYWGLDWKWEGTKMLLIALFIWHNFNTYRNFVHIIC